MEAEQAEDARAVFAQIVGARPEEVAIVPPVSSAAGIVAANMPLPNSWRAGEVNPNSPLAGHARASGDLYE